MRTNFFLDVIRNLRENEEILLYNNLLQIAASDEELAITFLQEEYEEECLNFPYEAPLFNGKAALYGARMVYIAAQLLLYRQHADADLQHLLPVYTEPMNASAILSADVCLRFIPGITLQLSMIDGQDRLIEHLETLMTSWHYSAINYQLPIAQLDFGTIQESKCLHQLYSNRIVAFKKIQLAMHPVFQPTIAANLGLYAKELWKDFFTEQRLKEDK